MLLFSLIHLLWPLAVVALPSPAGGDGESSRISARSRIAKVDCTQDSIHCITSRGLNHSNGIYSIPCMYADSTGSPNGLECDSYILNSKGEQVGLTGNCGATSGQTPSFLVACRDVQIIQGYWVLSDEQTYSSDSLLKIAFDALQSQDGDIGSYWLGEDNAPEIALANMTSMSFRLNSLMSAQKQVDWTTSGKSFLPGVDVLLGCPQAGLSGTTNNGTDGTDGSSGYHQTGSSLSTTSDPNSDGRGKRRPATG